MMKTQIQRIMVPLDPSEFAIAATIRLVGSFTKQLIDRGDTALFLSH